MGGGDHFGHAAGAWSVFLGHSMGSVSAITSAYHWLKAGKTVDAVVLLAPAISLRTLAQPGHCSGSSFSQQKDGVSCLAAHHVV